VPGTPPQSNLFNRGHNARHWALALGVFPVDLPMVHRPKCQVPQCDDQAIGYLGVVFKGEVHTLMFCASHLIQVREVAET